MELGIALHGRLDRAARARMELHAVVTGVTEAFPFHAHILDTHHTCAPHTGVQANMLPFTVSSFMHERVPCLPTNQYMIIGHT